LGAYAFSGSNVGTVFEGDCVDCDLSSNTEAIEQELGTGVGGWVTVDELEYGPSMSANLDFSRGATTTPGGLFRILNSSTAKVCSTVELNITDGTGTGGPTGIGTAMVFSVATSSTASAFSSTGGTLVASTTNATSSQHIISSVRNAGTYVASDQDVGGESWVWEKGVFLLGAFDDPSALAADDYATSSTAYTGMAGKAYVSCHVE